MYYVYILYSKQFDKYYIGHTDNPERRLEEHNTSSHNTYTRKYRPWDLRVKIAVSENRGMAMRVEHYLKKQKSRRVLNQLIDLRKDMEGLSALIREWGF